MKTIHLFTLLLFFSHPLFSQTHNWQRTNPGGGGAFSTIGASASGIILAGSDLSGAYRSTDGGNTWDVIGADKGLTETHVSGLGFHQTDGDILYIGTENGIFRSDDGGNSVSHVLVGGYITDIEFGTNVPTTGYAAYHPMYNSNQGVIYKSTDNGLSWLQVSTNLPGGLRILKLLVNPNDVNTVYLLSGEGRFACGPAEVYKSTDGGVTWTNLTASLPEILDVALSPANPNHVFITTMNADCSAPYYWTDLDGDLYKSTNGGNSWGSPLANGRTGVIWIDKNNANIIRLIDPREPYTWNPDAGTWTSTDGGQTFSHTGFVNNWDTFFNGDPYYCYGASFNGICKTLGEDLSNPDVLYWVNSQWVFKTTDGGDTFQNLMTNEVGSNFWQSRGFDNVNMMDIAISPADPDIIYLAYFDMGIWRSLDHGQSWQSCNHANYTGDWDGRGGNCATILADPDRPNVVWASNSENQNGEPPTYLLKNTNTGEKNSWSLSNSGLPTTEVMGLSIDPNSPVNNRTLYVTANKDVYKSTDDGASWTKVFNCNGCRFTAVDYFDGNLVYAGGENGLWRSTDAGNTWTDVSQPDMPSSGTDFWDYGYDGVFDIKTDPNIANTVFVVAHGNNKGLYKSSDSGNTWTHILTDDYLRKVAIMPQNSNILYATSSSAFEAGGYDPASQGVLFSYDGGQNWTQQNQNMAWPFALAVAIDHTATPDVFVGSPGTGFQYAAVDLNILAVSYLQPLRATSENGHILLSWQYAPNPQADRFEVQRSDNLQDWESIQIVNAQHHAPEITCELTDLPPYAGWWYYRLKQYDKDGSFTYSNIAKALFKGAPQLKLYPNPAYGTLYGELSAPLYSGYILMRNSLGQVVHRQKIQGPDFQIELRDLQPAPGMYSISLQVEGHTIARTKIVLQTP